MYSPATAKGGRTFLLYIDMHLIKWENNKIVIAPEAYAIKAFRDIWDSDKSDTKEKAILLLGTLYFMYHPGSDFNFEIDEETRLEKVKEQTGLPHDWEPDTLFKNAVPVYKYLTNTTSSITLNENKRLLARISQYLDEVEINDKNLAALTKSISERTALSLEISKAEREIYKDVEEHSAKMRGKGTKTIGDDGLAHLFNTE